ncbi:hypothetical protein D3C86_1462550 [compost metagenome]
MVSVTQFEFFDHVELGLCVTRVLELVGCLGCRAAKQLLGFEGLELDCICPSFHCNINQLLGEVNRSVMVDPGFGNDVCAHFHTSLRIMKASAALQPTEAPRRADCARTASRLRGKGKSPSSDG